MITKMQIWWHRRRAAYHNAAKHTSGFWNYHETWRDWHLQQITRLSK